jgi:hypothetical protein
LITSKRAARVHQSADLRRNADLTIEGCSIQFFDAIGFYAMCAWVRNVALRLLQGSHGLHLLLRAGFDRLIPFSLALKFISLLYVPYVHEFFQAANTGSTTRR